MNISDLKDSKSLGKSLPEGVGDGLRIYTFPQKHDVLLAVVQPSPTIMPPIAYYTGGNYGGKTVTVEEKYGKRSKNVYIGTDLVVLSPIERAPKALAEEVEARNRFAQTDILYASEHFPMKIQRGRLHGNTFSPDARGDSLAMEKIEVSMLWQEMPNEYAVFAQLAVMAQFFTDAGFALGDGKLTEFYVKNGFVGKLDFGDSTFFNPSSLSAEERDILCFRNFYRLVSQARSMEMIKAPETQAAYAEYVEATSPLVLRDNPEFVVLGKPTYDLLSLTYRSSVVDGHLLFGFDDFIKTLSLLDRVSDSTSNVGEIAGEIKTLDLMFLKNLVTLALTEKLGADVSILQTRHDRFMEENNITYAEQIEQLEQIVSAVLIVTLRKIYGAEQMPAIRSISLLLKKTLFGNDNDCENALQQLEGIDGIAPFVGYLKGIGIPPVRLASKLELLFSGKAYDGSAIEGLGFADSHYQPESYSQKWLEAFFQYAQESLHLDVLELIREEL